MKINLDRISERQQVLIIILTGSITLFALCFLLLTQFRIWRAKLELNNRNIAANLAKRNLFLPEKILEQHCAAEINRNKLLFNQWTNILSIIDFTTQCPFLTTNSNVGNIDFKVALFETKSIIFKKANNLSARLPSSIGFADVVASSEDSKILMIQLKTVETIINKALDAEIREIREVVPLKPVIHSINADENIPFCQEFAVRIEFVSNFPSIFKFLKSTLSPPGVFALRKYKLEPQKTDTEFLLLVRMELSALITSKKTELIEIKNGKISAKSLKPLGA